MLIELVTGFVFSCVKDTRKWAIHLGGTVLV